MKIVPRKKRELPNVITLEFALIDSFDTDDSALEERRKAFVGNVYSLRVESEELKERFKVGRIDTLTARRNELAETARAKAEEQREHEMKLGPIMAAINRASEQQAQAKSNFDSLKNSPPNKSRSTDSEWQRYEDSLKDVHDAWKRADFRFVEANTAHGNWIAKLQQVRKECEELERQCQLLDYQRDVLLGKADPNKRIHDAETGLQVTGALPGFIRSSNS